jgi:prepilin-type N-terminal cleavage/methylation domain-containing protein
MRKWLHARRALRAEHGFTLPELLVVLTIIGIVLVGITQLFTSAMKSQTDQTNRTQAQQDARLSLDKLRREIRCGSALAYNSTSSVTVMLPSYCSSSPSSPTTNLSGSVALPSPTIAVGSTTKFSFETNIISFGSSGTVTCTGTSPGQTSFTGCSGGTGTYASGTPVTSSNAAVTWCATTSGPPYELKRYVGNKTVAGGGCTGSGGAPWAGSLASSSIFPSFSGPPLTTLTTLNVSLVTDQTPQNASQSFALSDAITLRNSRVY